MNNSYSCADVITERFTTSNCTTPTGIWTRQICDIRDVKLDATAPSVPKQITALYRPLI